MKTFKSIFLMAVIFGIVSSLFSQNVHIEQKGEDVKRVGDKVWFVKNIQTDSLMCSGNITGMCQLKTSFNQEVEVVQADPSIASDKITEARKTGNDQLLSETPIWTSRQDRWSGFSYIHPKQQQFVHYDKEKHTAVKFLKSINIVEENGLSEIIFVVLLVYSFFLIPIFTTDSVSTTSFRWITFLICFTGCSWVYCAHFISFHDSDLTDIANGLIAFALFFISVNLASTNFFASEHTVFLVEKWEMLDDRKQELLVKTMVFVPYLLGIAVFRIQSSLIHGLRWIGILVAIYVIIGVFIVGWGFWKQRQLRNSPGIS